MSDLEWANNTAKNFRRVRAEKSQNDAVFLEQQKIRRAHIDDLWAKLRTALYSKVSEFNRAMQEQIVSIEDDNNPDKFQIIRYEPRTARLEVNCNRDTQEIKLVFPKNDVIQIGLGIDQSTGKAYLALANDSPKEPTEFAELAIEKLISHEL